MPAEDRPTFVFPEISYAGLSGDFDAPQDGPKPQHPHQLGFMIMYAARHGRLVDAPLVGREDSPRVQVSHPVPWAENVVTRVIADLHGNVGLIRSATLTAGDGSELSIILGPSMVTVGAESFILDNGTISDTQKAVAQAARGFFVEAANQPVPVIGPELPELRLAEPA